MSKDIVLVAGLGEVGQPLLGILSRAYECTGIDLAPAQIDRPCSVLHVCYPFYIPNFIGTTISYIKKYRPNLTIINSTVAPGTTRQVQQSVDKPVVYSPVRGKHTKMESDLLRYKKFVAGFNLQETQEAAEHFDLAGFKTATFRTPEIAELSKLVETTWLGLLVGWAQEVERMAAQCGGSYTEVNAFIEEISFLPSHVFPGHIGGHCVMPNIAILQNKFPSKLLEAITESNQTKQRELQSAPEEAEPEDLKNTRNMKIKIKSINVI